MSNLKHLMTWFAAAILAVSVAGCNTIRGAGEDVEAGGEAVSESAEATERELED